MGRLFQYNRFGTADSSRKDNSHNNLYRRKEKNDRNIPCPAYSELYGEYDNSTAYKNETCSKENMWINRLLCTDVFSSQALTCQVYSRSSTPRSSKENALLMGAVKRTKVFNCMKQFFKRKLFQQQNNNRGLEDIRKGNAKNWNTLDDITSDYDDLDNLDSSYNADEEDDYDDLSDDYACTPATKTVYRSTLAYRKLKKIHSPKESPLRSALSFSCWQQTHHEETTTTASNSDASTDNEEKKVANDNVDISDDAGISDCCQLIVKIPTNQKSYGRRKSKKARETKKARRFRVINTNNVDNDDNDDDDDSDECSDLLKTSWYQPRITTKAAYERLRQSLPGSFLVRRKARTYELCLRSETKVKHFTVIETNESYKLKGAQKQFSSLKALVTHHSVMAEQLPLTLLLPREKQFRNQLSMQRYEDDFDTFESLQILGILKSLQAKNFDR